MAEVAKAAAVMVHMETGEAQLVDWVVDDGTGMDPRYSCEMLWESVKDDWPSWEVGYISNQAADDLAGHRNMWSIGFKDDNPMAERIEAHNAEMKQRREAA